MLLWTQLLHARASSTTIADSWLLYASRPCTQSNCCAIPSRALLLRTAHVLRFCAPSAWAVLSLWQRTSMRVAQIQSDIRG